VLERVVHAVGEHRPVGQQGQRIVESQRVQLVVQPRGIGYVPDIQREAADGFHVCEVGDHHLVGALLTILLRDGEFGRLLRMSGGQHLVEHRADMRRFGAQHLVQLLPGEFARPHA
jgi:hypothetical protein